MSVEHTTRTPIAVTPSRPTAGAHSRRFHAEGNRVRPPDVARPRLGSPWWLWLHLLGLDAASVALAWQGWWSGAVGVRLFPSQRIILGLGVWMIYLADRLADTRRGSPDGSATARHAFARRQRGSLFILVVTIGASLVILAPCSLSLVQFSSGLILLAGAGAYFWLIHRRDSQSWTARVPKEAAVGAIFALGTAFFALCRSLPPPGSLAVAVAMFGSVCFLNCALITAWERNGCDQQDPFSFLNAFPRLAGGGLQAMCWSLAGVAAVSAWATHSTVFLPVTLSALSLGTLDRWRRRFSPDMLRSLADAVLLTPWICGGLLGLMR